MAGRAPSVVVIGGGMSGIGVAVKLQRAGVDDVTILEKAADYGGTWRENTYPGLACDVPAPFYTYTFAPNPGWTSRFAAGAEIHRYLCGVADRFGLRARTRFGCEVTGLTWEDGAWTVAVSDGEPLRADVVVAATGVLHRPRVPDLPGRDTFAGAAFHSARWDHDVALEGRRIGVVGTGSTGVQIVAELGDRGHDVVQFQRTPQWIFPMANTEYTVLRRAQRRWPGISRLLYRWHQWALEGFFEGIITPGWKRDAAGAMCRGNLRRIRDPALRARLTPTYEPMCKRLVMSWDYYRVVQQPNVSVVAAGVERVVPEGVVTDDGRLHELDVIVWATGFDAQAFLRPIDVRGQDGVTLAELWRDGPRAHQTIGLPGFPNLFMLLGPNGPIGNTSLFPIAEAQADAIVRIVDRIRAGVAPAFAPTAPATDAFNARLRAAMDGTVWVTGCDSWYLLPDGTPLLWPFPPRDFYAMLAAAPGADFAAVLPDGAPARQEPAEAVSRPAGT